MYITLAIDTTAINILVKDEGNITLQTLTFAVADYRIERSPDESLIYIQLNASPVYLWPPKASYPVDRIILIDNTQVPPILV